MYIIISIEGNEIDFLSSLTVSLQNALIAMKKMHFELIDIYFGLVLGKRKVIDYHEKF